jgi:hypothetical protein
VSVSDSEARRPYVATRSCYVRYAGPPVLVTAYYVLQRFIDLGPSGRLQIGTHRFTLQGIPPDQMLLSQRHDLVALALDNDDLSAIGKEMLPATQIAYQRVVAGQLVAFVGFPGYWKEIRDGREVGLGSYEFFGPVRTIEPDQFSLLVEPSYEIAVATTRATLKSWRDARFGRSEWRAHLLYRGNTSTRGLDL